jgi:transcriptional regulator
VILAEPDPARAREETVHTDAVGGNGGRARPTARWHRPDRHLDVEFPFSAVRLHDGSGAALDRLDTLISAVRTCAEPNRHQHQNWHRGRRRTEVRSPAVYLPTAFRMDDDEALELARRIGVGHLITVSDGRPESTLLPFTLVSNPDGPLLRAHLARANAHHRAMHDGAEALVVVHGPDAYVSANLYPSKAEHGAVVPTWNYVVVHLRGTIRPIDGDELLGLVSDLTDLRERERADSGSGRPWAVSDAPDDFIAAQLRAIVGIELDITSVEGKAKLSQNRPTHDHDAVRDAFSVGSPRERAVSAMMQRR